MGVEVTWNESAFTALETEIAKKSMRAAGRVRDRAKKIIRDEKRVDTGALMQSVTMRRVSDPTGHIRLRIASALPYAVYQHEGVKGPVYPRRARALRFKATPSGGGSKVIVFSRRSSGFEGIRFLARAIEDVSKQDFK